MNIPENILNTLTDEQKKKIEAAQSPEELQAVARETGVELTDEKLTAMRGDSRCVLQKPCRTNKIVG
jgi:hypothetical protein